jgi:hypothetical protein
MEFTVTAFNNRGGSNSICSFGYLTNQTKIFHFSSDNLGEFKQVSFNFHNVKKSVLNMNYTSLFIDYKSYCDDINCDIVLKLKNNTLVDTKNNFNYIYLIRDIQVLTFEIK